MSEARELTTDEVRDAFLAHIRALVTYWDHVENRTSRRKLEGFAHSILAMLDGAADLPGFIVAPRPHANDREYLRDEGENWYPENHHIEDQIKADIAGTLHDLFYQRQEASS